VNRLMKQNKVVNKITICACNYRRPQGLRLLLESVRELEIPPGVEVEICIVDNDVLPSARDVIAAVAADFPLALHYAHETQPGIPNARNRALSDAGAYGYAVFVDDDETVDPKWLVELYRVACETGGAFVQGPVEMSVEDSDDQWWLETFFAIWCKRVEQDSMLRTREFLKYSLSPGLIGAGRFNDSIDME